MAAYLDSLERLKAYAPRAIAPGHGRVIGDPVRVIDSVIAHRGRREAKVLAVLDRHRRGTLDELLPAVYDDVKSELLPIARYSLEAHLIKLHREGRAERHGDIWVASARAAQEVGQASGQSEQDGAGQSPPRRVSGE